MDDALRFARKIAKECLGMRVREASRLVSRVYDASLRPLGLQSSQLAVLVALALFGEKGAMVGPLAERLGMDRTTLTRSGQPLERAGWLRVSRSPDDARARVVTLTRAGEKLLADAYPLWEGAQQRVRELLGPARLDSLRSELSQVIELGPELEGDTSSG